MNLGRVAAALYVLLGVGLAEERLPRSCIWDASSVHTRRTARLSRTEKRSFRVACTPGAPRFELVAQYSAQVIHLVVT